MSVDQEMGKFRMFSRTYSKLFELCETFRGEETCECNRTRLSIHSATSTHSSLFLII